jgi:uncharacterized membrane protein YjgN (DUF898 family)
MHFTVAPSPGRTLRIRFSGSGSEYFRIWIVNLLLTIVTLSLYHPFAKARRLAYFHANTRVDGDALAFHGDPKKMLRGYLLMLLFSVTYIAAGRFNPIAAGLAGIAFAAMWPALWRASLRFRLANTSWRGLRMRFSGSTRDAYTVFLPLVLPLGLFGVLTAVAPQEPGIEPPWWIGLVAIGALVAVVVLVPMWFARARRYQQDHSHWAGEQARLGAGTGAFYAWGLRSIGLSLLAAVVVGAVVGGVAVVTGATQLGIVLGLVAAYVAVLAVAWPYGVARLQNLVWGRTRSEHLRFHSRLGARALAWRMLKNLLLTLVTLGLYRPFAAVATARLRLEAVQLELDGDPAEWRQRMAERMDDAAGDFAGDFFGIDLGL